MIYPPRSILFTFLQFDFDERFALEKFDVTFDDLFVVKVADTVESVADGFGVVIPIAIFESGRNNFLVDFDIDFNRAGERSLPFHSLLSEDAELIFEFGVTRWIETTFAVGIRSRERNRLNGRGNFNGHACACDER